MPRALVADLQFAYDVSTLTKLSKKLYVSHIHVHYTVLYCMCTCSVCTVHIICIFVYTWNYMCVCVAHYLRRYNIHADL